MDWEGEAQAMTTITVEPRLLRRFFRVNRKRPQEQLNALISKYVERWARGRNVVSGSLIATYCYDPSTRQERVVFDWEAAELEKVRR